MTEYPVAHARIGLPIESEQWRVLSKLRKLEQLVLQLTQRVDLLLQGEEFVATDEQQRESDYNVRVAELAAKMKAARKEQQ